MTAEQYEALRFGGAELRARERQLLIDGVAVTLGARAFDLLLALVERRARIVSKIELLDLVWPGLVVEENNLQVQVSALRKLLGPHAISTIPGRGYQFSLRLNCDAGGEPLSNPESHHLRGAKPATTPASRPGKLPAAGEPLIGREADIAVVLNMLTEHRLITVMGVGGIGKTQLAQEVARRAASSFVDGVRWVDLAALSSPDRIPHAIAAAADLRLAEGDAVNLLVQGLAARDTLLVLDNCEHLIREVARIAAAALDGAPRIRVITTSQDALRVPGEQLYRLDALAVPPPGTSIGAALEYSALKLLQTRAGAIDRRYRLGEQNVAAAIELCSHLGGIPLALEMAAARLPALGLDALLARLGDRLKLLRNNSRSGPARHQTLRATLDWSHSLLNATEQAVLRRLSVFAGSFGLEAARLVVCAEDLDEWSALDALTALVDRSMVRVEQPEPPRYRLLETTRLYASERLAENHEAEPVEVRHGQAMIELADDLLQDYWLTGDTVWLSRFALEQDDLTAAFDRACRRGDTEVAAATGEALVWQNRVRSVRSGLRQYKETLRALLPQSGPRARARIWNSLAMFPTVVLAGLSRLEISRKRIEAWRAIGDPRQIYLALGGLSIDHARAGDIGEAQRVIGEAARLEDPAWPAGVRAWVAQNVQFVSKFGGDASQCRTTAQTALQLALQAGSERLAADARSALADAALMAGEFGQAIELSQAAVLNLAVLGQPLGLALAQANLGAAYLMIGDLPSARSAIGEAIATGWQHETAAYHFDHLALLAARSGRPVPAALMLGYCDEAYASAGTRRLPNEARLERLSAAAADEQLGSGEFGRLRAAGCKLTLDQAKVLAHAELLDREAGSAEPG